MDRIEYKLTENDLLLFNLYYSAHSDLQRKQLRRHRVSVPATYVVLAIVLCLSKAFVAATLFVLFAAGWFAFSPWLMRRRSRQYYAKHIRETAGESLRTPMTLELRPDGIYTSSYVGEAKYRYLAVDRIVENDGYTYVFLGKGMALVLPHDRIPKETVDLLAAEITRRKDEETRSLPAHAQ